MRVIMKWRNENKYKNEIKKKYTQVNIKIK